MIVDIVKSRRGIYRNQVDNIMASIYKLRTKCIRDEFLDPAARVALDDDLEAAWTKLYSLTKELERT